jgi:DNA polymerase-3 subunit gamma/tau
MLTEKYRPQRWEDVIGQPKALATIERMRARGLAGRAWWISGSSGQGKTTIARLLAGEIASGFAIEELDAGGLTSEFLRDWRSRIDTYGFGKGGRALIVNEAHGLRADVIRRLLVLLEELPDHVVVVFTTTKAGQAELFDDHTDASPLLSRCILLALTNQGLSTLFAEHAQRVAQTEGLDGQPITAYVRLAKECRGNLRDMLNRIDAGCMMADDSAGK